MEGNTINYSILIKWQFFCCKCNEQNYLSRYRITIITVINTFAVFGIRHQTQLNLFIFLTIFYALSGIHNVPYFIPIRSWAYDISLVSHSVVLSFILSCPPKESHRNLNLPPPYKWGLQRLNRNLFLSDTSFERVKQKKSNSAIYKCLR